MIKTVAFFGLGAMGYPMAENLLRAGYTLHSAVHRSRDAAEDLANRYGLLLFDNPYEAVKEADAIITLLPADPEIKAFLMDERLADALKNDAIIVDMSSSTTDAIVQVEKFYRPRHIPVVDAPVSGGVNGAKEGTLTIFASGEASALAVMNPLFEIIGSQIFTLGSCGMGKAFKNLNNLLSMVNVVVISEMAHIATANGFDTDLLYDVIAASSGMSASFKNRFKKMVSGDFEGGFKQELARKDVGNAIDLGNSKGVPLPMVTLAHQLMQANEQYDQLDAGVIYRLFE